MQIKLDRINEMASFTEPIVEPEPSFFFLPTQELCSMRLRLYSIEPACDTKETRQGGKEHEKMVDYSSCCSRGDKGRARAQYSP